MIQFNGFEFPPKFESELRKSKGLSSEIRIFCKDVMYLKELWEKNIPGRYFLSAKW